MSGNVIGAQSGLMLHCTVPNNLELVIFLVFCEQADNREQTVGGLWVYWHERTKTAWVSGHIQSIHTCSSLLSRT